MKYIQSEIWQNSVNYFVKIAQFELVDIIVYRDYKSLFVVLSKLIN